MTAANSVLLNIRREQTTNTSLWASVYLLLMSGLLLSLVTVFFRGLPSLMDCSSWSRACNGLLPPFLLAPAPNIGGGPDGGGGGGGPDRVVGAGGGGGGGGAKGMAVCTGKTDKNKRCQRSGRTGHTTTTVGPPFAFGTDGGARTRCGAVGPCV